MISNKNGSYSLPFLAIKSFLPDYCLASVFTSVQPPSVAVNVRVVDVTANVKTVGVPPVGEIVKVVPLIA